MFEYDTTYFILNLIWKVKIMKRQNLAWKRNNLFFCIAQILSNIYLVI